jgi:hypothetical protein
LSQQRKILIDNKIEGEKSVGRQSEYAIDWIVQSMAKPVGNLGADPSAEKLVTTVTAIVAATSLEKRERTSS